MSAGSAGISKLKKIIKTQRHETKQRMQTWSKCYVHAFLSVQRLIRNSRKVYLSGKKVILVCVAWHFDSQQRMLCESLFH